MYLIYFNVHIPLFLFHDYNPTKQNIYIYSLLLWEINKLVIWIYVSHHLPPLPYPKHRTLLIAILIFFVKWFIWKALQSFLSSFFSFWVVKTKTNKTMVVYKIQISKHKSKTYKSMNSHACNKQWPKPATN